MKRIKKIMILCGCATLLTFAFTGCGRKNANNNTSQNNVSDDVGNAVDNVGNDVGNIVDEVGRAHV